MRNRIVIEFGKQLKIVFLVVTARGASRPVRRGARGKEEEEETGFRNSQHGRGMRVIMSFCSLLNHQTIIKW